MENTASRSDVHRFEYDGTGLALAGLMLKNFILTILTFGIYSFWAKTNSRRFIWQHIKFAGDRLEYTGTAIELLTGFAKVIGIYLLITLGLQAVSYLSATLGAVLGIIFGLLFAFALIPAAIYLSRNYRLTRTHWRGINFGMSKDLKGFIKEWGIGYLLVALTFGIYFPWFQNRVHKALYDRTFVGTTALKYSGQVGPLLKHYLFLILTLGLYTPWFVAKLKTYRLRHTFVGDAHFKMIVSGGDILGLWIIFLLGLMLSFGLALPWLITYSLNFWTERIALIGHVNFETIGQASHEANSVGDELGDLADIDIGL